ncbi:MAG: hypothetical protein PUC65_13880 [Clostridiales bacterium]|nr:hypothetical protein [Clostridiales bacterium]
MGKNNVVTNSVPAEKSKKLYKIGGIIVAVILIAIIAIFIENAGKYKLTVENNTSKNLEYVKLHFESMDTDFNSDVFFNQPLAANKTVVDKVPKLNLYNTEARLYVVFKFEGEEEQVFDNGLFNYNFYGKTFVTFGEKDGMTTLDVSIKQGFFSNDNYNECDEHWEF